MVDHIDTVPDNYGSSRQRQIEPRPPIASVSSKAATRASGSASTVPAKPSYVNSVWHCHDGIHQQHRILLGANAQPFGKEAYLSCNGNSIPYGTPCTTDPDIEMVAEKRRRSGLVT